MMNVDRNINKNEIYKFIEENEPVCVSGIAEKFNISWATSKTILLELVLEGKVRMKKCGKTWIVWVKAF